MIDPYRMVIINLTALSIICAGIFFYRFLYPKKQVKLFPLLLIVMILPVISILRKGTYESGDFNMHIYRAMMFFENLQQGNIIPSWGGELNATYGYPVFIFNYVLHYYLISFFHFLGFSFLAGMKLFLILSVFGSGITMYLWANKIFKNQLAGFAAAVFYVFAPYHLITLHFRVNGENFAYALAPLLFYQLHNVLERQNTRNILFFGLILGLLFFAHSANAAFTSLFMIIYLLLLFLTGIVRRRKQIIAVVEGYLVGILLALPVFFAHSVLSQYTYGYLLSGKPTFTPLWQLLYSPWRYGLLFQGPKGEFAFLVGYTQLLLLVTMVLLLIYKKIKKVHALSILFWLSVTCVTIFLVTPQSAFLWKIIPILSLAQFSYRLLFFVNISTAILAGYLVLSLPKKKKAIYVLIFFTIASTIINWGNRRTIPEIGDITLRQNIPLSSWNYEGMAVMASPRWLKQDSLWEKKIPDSHLESLSGSAEIRQIERSQTKHTYIVNAKKSLLLRENTLYFPGWEVWIDNKQTLFEYKKNHSLGKIVFPVTKGLHFIEVKYNDLPLFRLTKLISIAGFVVIFLYFIGEKLLYLFPYEKKSLR
ncbi:MAG: hypothetical protein RLZZ455_418 [Candidatus Parcubacteria bacterium]|jgi:hypothetical protein